MLLLIGILITYIAIAWTLKRLIWCRASKMENENPRLFWKSFYVALVAAPTLTPTLPFSIPVPAVTMLVSGLLGPFINGMEFWKYDLIVRAFYSGLAPIMVVSVLGFGLAKIVVRSRAT